MRVRRFSVRLSRPLRTARGRIDEREGFLVAVGDDDVDVTAGIGVGEATPLPGWTESLGACESAIESIGEGHLDPDEIDPDETPAARHAVALALDDAAAQGRGRSLGTRLAERVGLSRAAESVPVNATIGDESRGETVAAAERAVDDGYRCLKIKVGARSVDADVERLRAVREAVGPAVELRADANGAWDRARAGRALDRLEGIDLAYVEQPLSGTDLAGTARLRAEHSVPIALDESLATHPVEAVISADAADAVVLKPMALGGPDRAVAAAKRALAAGIEPVVTTTIDAVVARTAAVHVAGAIPDVTACGLATGEMMAEDLAPDPCPVEEGRIAVPDGPGLAADAFENLL